MQIGFNNWQEDVYGIINLKTSVKLFFIYIYIYIGHTLLNIMLLLKKEKKKALNRVFSHDVTAAILVSQNNEPAAMLVSQTNPLGAVLFSYANAFFCSNKFA